MSAFRVGSSCLCLIFGSCWTAACHGELFTFDVPELVGSYQNSGKELALNLETQFSSISSVSMRLTGTHWPGIYGDLNFPGAFPYPAELIGTLPELTYPATTGFDVVLSKNSGSFDKTLLFHRWLPPKVDDFSLLLDGVADLSFGVGSPPLIATTYVLSFPRVEVGSAMLLVEGTALAPRIGDYNDDGTVDDQDILVWRETFGSSADLRADGNGNGTVDAADFTLWRDHMTGDGTSAFAPNGAIPEPSALLLASLTCCLWRCRRRSKSTAAA